MTGALLLTVGTGNERKLEQSLYIPLLKSIDTDAWERVVLLPSLTTLTHAEELRTRRPEQHMQIRPLPEDSLEDNVDSCFAHFDAVIAALLDEGFSTETLVADYTRGTKAMSAALVLAAVRHDLSVLRYISGERKFGTVVAGTEEIVAVSPAVAIAQKQLDSARRFAGRGNFAGALALLEDDAVAAWPAALAEEACAVRPALRFSAAWDRLDYRTAAAIEPADAAPLAEWQPLWPTPAGRAWLAGLAATPPAGDCAAMAARLRLLACDLLANGERRIRDQHYEDAALRAYRVLELERNPISLHRSRRR